MSIGYRIKKLRKKKNITQLDLANKLFVTDKTISSWESNRTEPGLELLINQVDTYYQPSYRKFIPENLNDIINEWLRIGKRGNKIILNYKNWHDNMYCDEYEVEIDNSKNLDRIFNVLGLEKIVVVDKQRKTYYYLDKYEIAFDYVKELGYFIEIEVKNYSKDPIEEYNDLLNLARDLNLSFDNIDKRGYPYHLIFGI